VTRPDGSATRRYDKQPSIRLPTGSSVWTGVEAWQEIDRFARHASRTQPPAVVTVVLVLR